MSYGTFQGILTIIMMVIFLGIVAWAYSKKQKTAFDRAANSIFDDEPPAEQKSASKGG